MRLVRETLRRGLIFIENILTYMSVCMNSLGMTCGKFNSVKKAFILQ